MRRMLIAACGFASLSAPAYAGEVHIISRDSIGYFISSRQIYSDERKGLVKVDYCNKSYFALPSTVEWTEYETENGRKVGVEYGDGTNWRLICNNPQDQVRYADVKRKLKGRSMWEGPKWFTSLYSDDATR